MILPTLALSIRQPWAFCIVRAGKDIENRDWKTTLRGPICIHAAKGMTREEYEDCLVTVHHVSLMHPFPSGQIFPAFDQLQRGGIVGTAEIVGCVSDSVSPWFFGKYGFVLANAQTVEFIPVKGQLGFFDWRKNLTEASAPAAPAQGSLL
ncbi:ASCH domain-containing protein [Rhizobium rhizogenes]|uniref:ASCH domain-containing protein n=1 Tax=Rhizobium rhizogenes TaxID=359 RepID=UPI0015745DD6|nr:ASCH domain-containing protein [Rhizobium rhizogenes]NTI27624.1 ASCH domain-containing protein [Rhizobium rhizogenes]